MNNHFSPFQATYHYKLDQLREYMAKHDEHKNNNNPFGNHRTTQNDKCTSRQTIAITPQPLSPKDRKDIDYKKKRSSVLFTNLLNMNFGSHERPEEVEKDKEKQVRETLKDWYGSDWVKVDKEKEKKKKEDKEEKSTSRITFSGTTTTTPTNSAGVGGIGTSNTNNDPPIIPPLHQISSSEDPVDSSLSNLNSIATKSNPDLISSIKALNKPSVDSKNDSENIQCSSARGTENGGFTRSLSGGGNHRLLSRNIELSRKRHASMQFQPNLINQINTQPNSPL
eukprot:TRINITY_DN5648_c0_g1_i3.p1 TRINITY_DN5648_c0_g1~~TRINITY_DN5648_c0_g1_i3.p1  ORF type:complete len:296 (-),score=79.76 TRINITY_DN5648_c0_g1_i3:95-937(-)